MVYFITGSTGLVGSHLLFELVRQGNTVKALKRRESNIHSVKKVFSYYTDNADELFNRINWVEGDILDYLFLCDALNEVDKVYHVAAFVSFNQRDKKNMLEYNIDGTANVVNACLYNNTRKLCFVSSTSALGVPGLDGYVDEDCIWKSSKTKTAYSISKFKSEMEVWRGNEEGLNMVIVNPSFILGPGNWHRSSGKLFETIGKGMMFFTRGITGYVGVKDVVHAMIQLMESDIHGERFIVSENNYSYQQIFSMIAEALKVKKPVIYAGPFLTQLASQGNAIGSLFGKERTMTNETAKAAHDQLWFNNKKIISALNFQFTPVENVIKETGRIFLTEKHKGIL